MTQDLEVADRQLGKAGLKSVGGTALHGGMGDTSPTACGGMPQLLRGCVGGRERLPLVAGLHG